MAATTFAQTKDTIFFPFASKASRTQQYKNLVDTTIYQYLSEPLNDDNEGAWNEAFWSMELIVYKNDYSKQKLTVAWSKANKLSEYFQKNLLEVTYALYPAVFNTQATALMKSTTSVPVFIRCAEYILRTDASEKIKSAIQSLITTKFKGIAHPGLDILQTRVTTWNKPIELPSLKDIFSKNFLGNQTIIYSLQRKSRAYAGLVVIRKPDGSFVKNTDSSIFHTAQLARAVTNYPFYISNGNTPQGIFRFTGFEVSKLAFIGPTPNIQMGMPFEMKPSVFFGDSGLVNTTWQKEMYASLLPASWKNYDGMYESFYAGTMGRYDIIMHGTAVNPEFYKGQTYYPQTPSLGCLCSYEEWDKNGMRIKSNQQQIDDALDSIGSSNGYVVVIELNDEKKAVSIDEVKKYLAPIP